MEFGNFLDVVDLPACLKRWDSNGSCEEGLLTVPSYDDFNNMKAMPCIFTLDHEDEKSSGFSLGSSPSNASSTMKADVDLGLGFGFEYFNDASELTCGSMDTATASPSIISLPAASLTSSAPCAPIGLPIGKLNLKLDASAVASAWNSIAGNAPVFSMPRSNLIAAAASIPSAEACAHSLSVETQEDWVKDASTSRPSSRNTSTSLFLHDDGPKKARRAAVHTSAPVSKPLVPRPPRKIASSSSSQKRKTGGKSSDKRPRIKGRFVRRDELERFVSAANDHHGRMTDDETLLVVPEALML